MCDKQYLVVYFALKLRMLTQKLKTRPFKTFKIRENAIFEHKVHEDDQNRGPAAFKIVDVIYYCKIKLGFSYP